MRGCLEGEVDVLEISYTLTNVGDVIKVLNDIFENKLLVGAETVLDGETAIPYMPILAYGRVSLDNLEICIKNGVDAVWLGGLLTKGPKRLDKL